MRVSETCGMAAHITTLKAAIRPSTPKAPLAVSSNPPSFAADQLPDAGQRCRDRAEQHERR